MEALHKIHFSGIPNNIQIKNTIYILERTYSIQGKTNRIIHKSLYGKTNKFLFELLSDTKF